MDGPEGGARRGQRRRAFADDVLRALHPGARRGRLRDAARARRAGAAQAQCRRARVSPAAQSLSFQGGGGARRRRRSPFDSRALQGRRRSRRSDRRRSTASAVTSPGGSNEVLRQAQARRSGADPVRAPQRRNRQRDAGPRRGSAHRDRAGRAGRRHADAPSRSSSATTGWVVGRSQIDRWHGPAHHADTRCRQQRVRHRDCSWLAVVAFMPAGRWPRRSGASSAGRSRGCTTPARAPPSARSCWSEAAWLSRLWSIGGWSAPARCGRRGTTDTIWTQPRIGTLCARRRRARGRAHRPHARFAGRDVFAGESFMTTPHRRDRCSLSVPAAMASGAGTSHAQRAAHLDRRGQGADGEEAGRARSTCATRSRSPKATCPGAINVPFDHIPESRRRAGRRTSACSSPTVLEWTKPRAPVRRST